MSCIHTVAVMLSTQDYLPSVWGAAAVSGDRVLTVRKLTTDNLELPRLMRETVVRAGFL
jgi:hypothetical protein